MDGKIKLAFEMEGVTVSVERILPSKQLSDSIRKGSKFRTIQASVKELGVIEPLKVFPIKKGRKRPSEYLLVDGHIRLEVLKELGEKEVFCLISKDDESYTYADKVNRLAPIQEHFMIVRTLERGVSEELIAKTLDVNVRKIKERRNMLNGICPEAVNILKTREVSPGALAALRKVKPVRQIEIADLMVTVGRFSAGYVKALVAGSIKDHLTDPGEPKGANRLRPEDLERVRREMVTLEKDLKDIESTYRENTFHLTIARGYLKKLLDNGKIVRFLSTKHGDILNEFSKIMDASPLDG